MDNERIRLLARSARVQVRTGDTIVADSRDALELRETGYPPRYYIAPADIAMDRLRRSPTRTHCPYKGDASYWSVHAGGSTAEDAAWSYEAPYPTVAAIAGYLSFYPDRVEIRDTEN
jgi:uncharacterized protein (DUF427 family)